MEVGGEPVPLAKRCLVLDGRAMPLFEFRGEQRRLASHLAAEDAHPQARGRHDRHRSGKCRRQPPGRPPRRCAEHLDVGGRSEQHGDMIGPGVSVQKNVLILLEAEFCDAGQSERAARGELSRHRVAGVEERGRHHEVVRLEEQPAAVGLRGRDFQQRAGAADESPMIAGRPGGQSGRAGADVHVENVGGLHVEGHGWLCVAGGAKDSLRDCAEAVTHADKAGDLDDVAGSGRFGRCCLDANPLESLLEIEEPARDDAGDDTRSPHAMARRGLGTVAGDGRRRHLRRLKGVYRWRGQHLDVGRSGDIEPGQ